MKFVSGAIPDTNLQNALQFLRGYLMELLESNLMRVNQQRAHFFKERKLLPRDPLSIDYAPTRPDLRHRFTLKGNLSFLAEQIRQPSDFGHFQCSESNDLQI
jgi:hypothetical protein